MVSAASIRKEDIKILKELKDFISPLSNEEFHYLEKNVLEFGCKEPLTLWNKGKEYFLIDGHHRYDICIRHDLAFQIEILKFDSIEQVQIWMVNNQMGRRNLTPDQLSYYRGKKYLLLKRSIGGNENVTNKGVQNPTTSKLLAKEFKVGESTIRRDAKFAEGLEVICQSNPELKNNILKGLSKFKKRDIQLISEFDAEDKSKLKVKNEADLFNKIARFRKDNIESIERKLEELENIKHSESQDELKSRDAIFLNQDERLERLKARIISAINDAIRNRNIKAIEDLKELIERLQIELENY